MRTWTAWFNSQKHLSNWACGLFYGASEDTAVTKLLILALLIIVLLYPVGGCYFADKKVVGDHGGDESDHK